MAALEDSLKDTLRQDEGLLRIVHGLALAETFFFYLLACDTPRVASAALAVLAEEASAERDETVRLVRLDPYRAHGDASSAIPFEVLADAVLARLMAPAPEEKTASVVLVVDASRAVVQDDGAWGLLFQRMNERRNVIAKALEGPLILVVPERLEPVFAQAAPDFWSIRSLAVVVREPLMGGDALLLELPTEESWGHHPVAEDEHTWSPEEIELEIEKARTEFTEHSGEPWAEDALIVWLDRLVEYSIRSGTPARALRAAEESTLLQRRRVEREPSNAQELRQLALGLTNMGDLYRVLGDLDRAYTDYNESVGIIRNLIKRAPTDHDYIHDMSVVLGRLGDTCRARGELEQALASYDEGLACARLMLASKPDSMEWQLDFSILLERFGDLQREIGKFDDAYEFYSESLVVRRGLFARNQEQIESLAISLDRLGRVCRERGELDAALIAFDECVVLRRLMLVRQPERVSYLRGLSASLSAMGQVYIARGDAERASNAFEESLEIARRLLLRGSDQPDALRDASLALQGIAEVSVLRGDMKRAEQAYSESLESVYKLLKREPDNAQWHHDLAVLFSKLGSLFEVVEQIQNAVEFWRAANAEFELLTRGRLPRLAWLKQAIECRERLQRLEATLASDGS